MTPSPSREDRRTDPDIGPATGSATGPARFQPVIGPDADAPRSPLRALGAGLALLLLVLGVPAALVWLAGPLSWPGSLPGRDELTGSLGTEQVLAVLLVVAWLAWAQFAVCVVVEVIAALRGGVLARPVPFSGPSQRLARVLVASVLVAGTIAIQSGAAFASAGPVAGPVAGAGPAVFAPGGIVATPHTAPTTRISPPGTGRQPTDHLAAPDVAPDVEPAETAITDVELVSAETADADDAELDGRKVYIVESPSGRHHDSLWAIAEEHLGDGRRYQEIFDLNQGRRQPDGRTLHLARLIQPGWQLIMPENATGVPRYVARSENRRGSTRSGTDGSAGTTGEGSVSSAAATSPAAAASRAAAASPAADSPTVSASPAATGPAAASAPASVPAVATPAASSPAANSATSTSGVTASPPVRETSRQTGLPGEVPAPMPPPGMALAQPDGPPATAARITPRTDDGTGLDWPGTEILGAGLLGAGLLGTLMLVRRRRGGTQPDDPAAEAEVWLRAGADADRSTLLDRALRTIHTSCAENGVALPQVYGAVVDNEGIDLLLSVPQPGAPWPWRDVANGMRWRLEIEQSDDLPDVGESAYPLIASVGRDDQGRDALINLGAAGGPVTVLGSPAMASAVVRALSLSLAGNPWSRGIEVLTCDLPETLPAIAAGRLVSCPSAENLTEQLEDGRQHLVRSGPAQVLTGGPVPGSRPERVAVYGQALPGPVAHRVEDLTRSSGSDLAVLMTGELAAARWRLRVDDTGRLTCDELSLAVTAHRLGDGSIERLHALFMAAAQPPARTPLPPGEPGRSSLAQPILEADDIAWAQAGARIALLGDVQVRADGPIEPGREELAGELVAYLALHPSGVHPAVLGSDLWPRGVPADVREETIEVARDWMGTDPDGTYRLRIGHDGRLRLSPNVVLDWDVLRTLLARARTAPATSRERDLLVRALHLVRGPIAGGASAGAYSWLARTDLEQQAENLIVDAADRLSEICLQDTDHVGVAQAAAAGLRARPDAQRLWRHILRAEYALGGPQRLAQVQQNMRDALTQEGVDTDAQTQALIDHLQAPTGSIPTSQRNSAS